MVNVFSVKTLYKHSNTNFSKTVTVVVPFRRPLDKKTTCCYDHIFWVPSSQFHRTWVSLLRLIGN